MQPAVLLGHLPLAPPPREGVAFSTRPLDGPHAAHTLGRGASMATEAAAVAVSGAPATGQVESKGLKKNAIGYVSNIVIGVGLDARRPTRSRRRSASSSPTRASACTRPAVLLASFVPMLLDLAGVPLPEQGRPRRRHLLRVDDARLRPDVRVAERLGDLPRRRARDGLARLRRRHVHLPALRMALGRNPHGRGARRLRPVDLADDVDLPPRHRALGARPAAAAELRGRDAGDLRGRRARRRLLGQRRRALDQAAAPTGSTRSR